MSERIKIIECPRDAMQGMGRQISWSDKAAYIAYLLACGFDTLDCGSFVNPAAVPQMADTAEVLDMLAHNKGNNRFLVIVANERGAREATSFETVDDLGFPFSINETFQKRNANTNLKLAFERLQRITEIANAGNKQVVAYISMAFGNPYNEPYQREDVLYWAEKIRGLGIRTISLADTVGSAETTDIDFLFGEIHRLWPELETGAHFHARPEAWLPKIEVAWNAGCRRFDGALMGFGGCPFAADDLVGNVPTEQLYRWLETKGETGVDSDAVQAALIEAGNLFGH